MARTEANAMSYAALELNGRVAVIIGGTSGIGREIADRGRRTLRAVSDVSDRGSLQHLLDETVRAFGKVDILVNSAGRTKRAPTVDFDAYDWSEILDTNLTGTLRACQVFGRHMIERGYGRIINIASIASFVALQEVAAYSASKAAVSSLTKSLAIEWAPHGVCVNASDLVSDDTAAL